MCDATPAKTATIEKHIAMTKNGCSRSVSMILDSLSSSTAYVPHRKQCHPPLPRIRFPRTMARSSAIVQLHLFLRPRSQALASVWPHRLRCERMCVHAAALPSTRYVHREECAKTTTACSGDLPYHWSRNGVSSFGRIQFYLTSLTTR